MKIATPTRPTPLERPVRPAPLQLDSLGLCRTVLPDPPRDDAGWLSLVDRVPPGGHELVAHLVAAISRLSEAQSAVSTALGHVGARRREKPGEPLPASWVDRLCALYDEVIQAYWCLDDRAADAAVEPRWVAVVVDPFGVQDRPIPSTEVSWPRVARIHLRLLDFLRGTGADMDEVWAVLGSLETTRACAETDAAGARERGRRVVEAVTRRTYGATEVRG